MAYIYYNGVFIKDGLEVVNMNLKLKDLASLSKSKTRDDLLRIYKRNKIQEYKKANIKLKLATETLNEELQEYGLPPEKLTTTRNYYYVKTDILQ